MTDTATHTPDDAWAMAREMYLNGATGSHVCRRFGFSASTFWARAAREGWLRKDNPEAVVDAEPLDPDAPAATATASRDKAWQRFSRAVEQGRATEAQRWLGVHNILCELADREAALARAEAREAARAADPEAAQQRVEDLRAAVFAQAGARDWRLEK